MEVIEQYLPSFVSYLTLKNTKVNNYILSLIENNIYTSSNSFLILLLSFYIKQNFNVLFVAEKESLNYYATIMRKFGLNILNNENIGYIDMYKYYENQLNVALPLTEQYPDSFNPLKSKIYNIPKSDEYSELLKIIEEQYGKLFKENENKKYILVFDKISDINDGLKNILKYCCNKNMSIVYTLNKELNDNFTFNFLENLTDIYFYFKENESGFSKDIDGILDIRISVDKLNNSIDEDKYASLRYFTKTNGINFFTHLNI